MTLDWQLRNAADRIVGRGTARSDGTDTAWEHGKDGLPAALAHDAAPAIARLVAGDAPPPAANVAATLKVARVSGAPGDGSASLARAIAAALGRAGVDVASGGGRARFTLSCQVETAPVPNGQQRVVVRWVLAAANGATIGQVAQQNTIPAGTLDGAWGDIAYAVAGAAAPGIAQLIERAKIAAVGG